MYIYIYIRDFMAALNGNNFRSRFVPLTSAVGFFVRIQGGLGSYDMEDLAGKLASWYPY